MRKTTHGSIMRIRLFPRIKEFFVKSKKLPSRGAKKPIKKTKNRRTNGNLTDLCFRQKKFIILQRPPSKGKNCCPHAVPLKNYPTRLSEKLLKISPG
jgi:hypothetical protein